MRRSNMSSQAKTAGAAGGKQDAASQLQAEQASAGKVVSKVG